MTAHCTTFTISPTFPTFGLSHLDAAEDLVHELDPLVLVLHLLELQLLGGIGDEAVHRHQDDHDGEAGEHRGP